MDQGSPGIVCLGLELSIRSAAARLSHFFLGTAYDSKDVPAPLRDSPSVARAATVRRLPGLTLPGSKQQCRPGERRPIWWPVLRETRSVATSAWPAPPESSRTSSWRKAGSAAHATGDSQRAQSRAASASTTLFSRATGDARRQHEDPRLASEQASAGRRLGSDQSGHAGRFAQVGVAACSDRAPVIRSEVRAS